MKINFVQASSPDDQERRCLVTGHDFSRAAKSQEEVWASAPAESPDAPHCLRSLAMRIAGARMISIIEQFTRMTGSGSRKRCRIEQVLGLLAILCMTHALFSQAALQPFAAQPSFPLHSSQDKLVIQHEVMPSRPFSVVGPRGAVLGQQDGSFEVWLFPWKILSDVRITARMDNYPVPIDVNDRASSIEVRPYATIITFSHANFTVREIILAPKQTADSAGALVLYQIEAVRPMTLTFSFTPNMQRMWPAESDDRPSPEWVNTDGSSGFYMLHLNFPDHAAAIAMPTAKPGIMEPYQERAASYPLQFVLHFDPASDAHTIFPMLIALGNTTATSTKEALADQIGTFDRSVRSIYEANQKYYANLLASSMSIETPDAKLNDAFAWAEVSIDQLRVETTPDHSEEGLTAGFLGSGDSVRPGFGWFFGRDALWTIYALNSDGNFATTRKAIEFLLDRQSPEGKIMHEWSQTADLVDWKSLPYEYRAADSTPLLSMTMNDYLRISGDKDFIAAHWENLERAWKFECSHDTDGDGILSNSEGTAWVESWVPSMPRQEIYLAALDEQASLAFANLARATGHNDLASQADARATHLRELIEKQYFVPADDFYAFSWNGAGSIDTTPTIFPSVAWWDGDYSLDRSQAMLSRWASAEFSTDWGTRLTSDRVSFYDPISYHQGSVWPLFTGWVSVAEYRTGHSLSGYAHLMQNADLTWSQDLGSVTELLSGRFFQPLGRSSAHQLWSSAMVISPVVRGLLGLTWDVPSHTLSVTPHLPADWQDATVRNVPFGNRRLDLRFTRSASELVVDAIHAPPGMVLASQAPGARMQANTIHIPLPSVEVAMKSELPEFGAETRQLKVLDQKTSAHSCTLTLAGIGGETYELLLRENAANLNLHADGATLGASNRGLRTVSVEFPAASGYATKTVTFSW
jgi:glycogen debranching enzyme